jgi:hypothetical protein
MAIAFRGYGLWASRLRYRFLIPSAARDLLRSFVAVAPQDEEFCHAPCL